MWILISRLLVANNEAPSVGTSRWRGASSGTLARSGPPLLLPMLGPLPCPVSSLQSARLGADDRHHDGLLCLQQGTPAPAFLHPPEKLFCPLLGPWLSSPSWAPIAVLAGQIARSVCLQEKNCLRQACQNPSQPDTQCASAFFFFFFLIKRKKSNKNALHKAGAVWLV